MPTIACLDFGCKKAEKYIRNQEGNFDSIKFFICSKVFTLINFAALASNYQTFSPCSKIKTS